MLLLIAIIQKEDAPKLAEQLVAHGHRFTQINSTGGFLAAGNVALLFGIAEEKREEVIELIRATCEPRVRYVNATPWLGMTGTPLPPVVTPMEVVVGGAVVFGFAVKRFLRLQGGSAPPVTDEKTAVTGEDVTGEDVALAAEQNVAAGKGIIAMNLVIAIVQSAEADAVVQALLAAGHRLTRINTAGGFLRRGNATLLIGVEPEHLEEVLALIQANCRLHTEANPVAEGMPMYGATVFVLDASHFFRV